MSLAAEELLIVLNGIEIQMLNNVGPEGILLIVLNGIEIIISV